MPIKTGQASRHSGKILPLTLSSTDLTYVYVPENKAIAGPSPLFFKCLFKDRFEINYARKCVLRLPKQLVGCNLFITSVWNFTNCNFFSRITTIFITFLKNEYSLTWTNLT